MTSTPEDFTKEAFLLVFLGLLFLVLPGVASLFIYKGELFASLDWIKLALLGASMVLPLGFINTIFFLIVDAKNNAKVEFSGHFAFGTIVAGLSFYITLAVGHFFIMSLGKVIGIATVADIIVFAFVFLRNSKKK